MDTANDLHNTVAVARCDLEVILAHCRRTWPKGDSGYSDAVHRAHYALGQPVKDAAAGPDRKSTAAAPDYQSGQSVGSASFETCDGAKIDAITRQRNLYAGAVDARQTDSATLPADAGLFRKRYRALDLYEKNHHDMIKDAADWLAREIGRLNPSVYGKLVPDAPINLATIAPGKVYDAAGVTLALRHLEDAVYRAVKALTA